MLRRLGQKLSDIIYPSFSELELTTLFYLLVLLVIEQRSFLVQFVGDQFTTALQISDFYERLKTLAGWTMGMILIFFFFISLGLHALKDRAVSIQERDMFSFFFYTFLAVISLLSVSELIYKFSGGRWYDLIEGASVLFLLGRSLFALVLTYIFLRQGSAYIYSDKMTSEQLNKRELILLIFLSTITYLILRGNHTIPSALSLSYFYVTTTALFFRKLTGDKVIIH